MPTYEYECTACGHAFEVVQSMKDPHLTDCPQAGCAGPVRRKIGRGAGIIFKGSGFYQTDYRSESYKAAAKKESGGGESGGSSAAAAASSGSTATPAAPAAPAPAPAAAPTPSTASSSGKAA
jgi:putative FmdB family regulatory protein